MTAQLVAEQRTLSVIASPFADIADSRYRQIAKELDGEGLVKEYWVDAPEAPEFLPMPEMRDNLRRALGVESLYSHQVKAWDALAASQSVVLQTPTASGKTLSTYPAIFQALLASDATAMALFPLKALCNDQVATIDGINSRMGNPIKVGLMTGDVQGAKREAIWNSRTCPQLVVWSPDVLHHFLYNQKKPEKYQQLRDYLKNLRFVFIDEAHTYQGLMGSHFANIRRRLELAVEKCGGDASKIQYIFATATVANGAEMIEKFSGRTPDQFTLIDKSGAGSRGRVTISMPPVSDSVDKATEIVAQWFKYGITGIVFCNSRMQAKSLVANIAKELGRSKANQVETYYGGMRDDERTRVVSALQAGTAKVVISTCALEAGIDIPAIDACLCVGFAGSIMGHRQRIGRAGRKSEALVIFMPSDRNSLDGYYGEEPQRLLYPPEAISFNAQYETILAGHLCAAAAESGIPEGREDELFSEGAAKLLHKLAKEGWEHDSFNNARAKAYPVLSKFGSGWSCKGYPHMGVAIRGNDATQISLVDEHGNDIEQMDKVTAIREVYSGGIYGAYRDGAMRYYRSDNLDLKELRCDMVQLPDDKLFTRAQTSLHVKVLNKFSDKVVKGQSGNMRLSYGWGSVTNATSGYKLLKKDEKLTCIVHGAEHINPVTNRCKVCNRASRLHQATEVIDEVTFDKAFASKMETAILQIEINHGVLSALEGYAEDLKQLYKALYEDVDDSDLPRQVISVHDAKPEFLGLHSFGHQLNLAFPTLVLGSSHDIDCHVAAPEPEDYDIDDLLVQTRLWIYDTTPGGSGASEQIFNDFERFVEGAHRFAKSCNCKHGCPRCLTLNRCGQRNSGLSKEMGLHLLGQFL